MNKKDGFFKLTMKKIIMKMIAWYVEEQLSDLNENLHLVNEKCDMLSQLVTKDEVKIEDKIQLMNQYFVKTNNRFEGVDHEINIQKNQIMDLLNLKEKLEANTLDKMKQVTLMLTRERSNIEECKEKYSSIEKILSEHNFLLQNLDSFKILSANKHASTEAILEKLSFQISECNSRVDRINQGSIEENKESIKNISNQLRDCYNKVNKVESAIGLEDSEKFDLFNKMTTSQAGEDSILAYVFSVLQVPFQECTYLDLGANHAKQLSNTYFFYTRGARGVLVEANPKLIRELKMYRSEDIIINRCIATESGKKVPFYILSGDGLSSPDRASIDEAMKVNESLQLVDIVNIETITVNEILEIYFDKSPLIMNIDIEGMEREIIESIDFHKFQPFAIIVERIEYSTALQTRKREDGMDELLLSNGYIEYAFTGINSIYLNKKNLDNFLKGGTNET